MAQSLPPIVFEPALRGVGSARYTSHFQKQKKRTLCNVTLYGDKAGKVSVLFGKQRQVSLNASTSNVVEVLREKLKTKIESLFAENGNAVPSTQARPETAACSSTAARCTETCDKRWENKLTSSIGCLPDFPLHCPLTFNASNFFRTTRVASPPSSSAPSCV